MQRLFSIFIPLLICAANVTPHAQTQAQVLHVTGRYSNFDYAFNVQIPDGIEGFRSPSPFPNHGFGIHLSKAQQAYLWVDASYNGLEWKSFAEAVKYSLEELRSTGATNVRLAELSATHLSRLRAVRFIINYNLSKKPMVDVRILSFRRDKNKDTEIVYSINLTTPATRFKRDRWLVSALQRAWRLQRQP